MKKILGIAGMILALAAGAQAAAIVVDFTNDPGSNNPSGTGITVPAAGGLVYDDYDFGDGKTADISITSAVGTLNSISVGIGVDGGTEGGRIGATEDLTITFSDFSTGFSASDISFTGFVAATAANGVWTIESGDVFDINGAALTGADTTDGVASALAFDYDDYGYQNLDSVSSVALNGSDALVLDLASDSGAGYRLQALSLTVIPEPATIGMLGLGTVAVLVFRRRMA
jgi:hypothetical protein